MEVGREEVRNKLIGQLGAFFGYSPGDKWVLKLETNELGEPQVILSKRLRTTIDIRRDTPLSCNDVKSIIKTLEDYFSTVKRLIEAGPQNLFPLVTDEERTRALTLLNKFCLIERGPLKSEIEGKLESRGWPSCWLEMDLYTIESAGKGMYSLTVHRIGLLEHSKMILSDNIRFLLETLEDFFQKYKLD